MQRDAQPPRWALSFMPSSPPKPCSKPGCSALVRDGSGRCEAHPRQKWAKSAALDGNTTQRGYGWAWQKLRREILARDGGLCQVALAEGKIEAATEVDHIINKATWLQLHGTLAGVDDPSNLQAISAERHRAKTQAEARGGGVESLGPSRS